MSLWTFIFKQLRQRSLSTVLTILSVALGVALATAILIIQREGDKMFGQTEYGFDVILGPKGSKLQLVLNNVYQVSEAQAMIPYHVYTDLATRLRRDVKWAVPIATGDTYRGHKLLATEPKIFESPQLDTARQSVLAVFLRAKEMVESTDKPGRLSTLPVLPNDPLLPQLFALQQDLDSAAKAAGSFDGEAKSLLTSASTQAGELVDLLATSTDLQAIQRTKNLLLDQAGGASALMGGPVMPRPNTPFALAEGKPFEVDKFECVLGWEAAQKLGMKVGDSFQASHGASEESETGHDHDEKWVITGILKPTQTAFDRVIIIPLTGFLAIPEHGKAMDDMARKLAEFHQGNAADLTETKPATQATATTGHDEHGEHHDHAYHLENGRIVLEVPKENWKISSILVRSRSGQSAFSLIWNYRLTPDAMAVNPAMEMREFTRTFLRGSSLLLLTLAVLVSIVAAVSILVSIYNSIASRRREIAILRALGATKRRILTLICLEAGVIGLIGSTAGLLLGMGISGGVSVALQGAMGEGLNWTRIGLSEGLYCVGAIGLAMVAGLVPALKAYSTSVSENLVRE